MVTDGNGRDQAVAHALVANEKRATLKALFSELKKSLLVKTR